MSQVSVDFEVPFHDVDSLNIVWHGHYYKYFELARTALYRSKNLDISDMQRLGYYFPVIESHCKYVQPLQYGQKVLLLAEFEAWEHYIKINYTIVDQMQGHRCAYGFTKQAACRPDGEMLLAMPKQVVELVKS